jgi:hypothetical protein
MGSEINILRSPGIVLVPWHVAACFHLDPRAWVKDRKDADTSWTYQNSSFTFHDGTKKSATDGEGNGWCTLASASLTPCTGTQREQRWQRPSSMWVRSSLPGRWRGVSRKAVGGENGRAVDAATPVSMHILMRNARTKQGVTYHGNTAYDSCRVGSRREN